MDPRFPTPDGLRHLLDMLPHGESPDDVIVRIDEHSPTTLTVRPTDGPPRVYRASGTGSELVLVDPAHDERLPGASLLVDSSGLARRLAVAEDDIRSIRLVAYRPRKRIVARVDVGPDRPALYLKFLTKNGYRLAEKALAALELQREPLKLVLPCRWLRKERILVTEEAGGTSLQALLLAEAPIPEDLLVRAIRLLPACGSPESLRPHRLEDERESALVAIRRGAHVLPEINELTVPVREASLPDSDGDSLLHTDLHTKQIFVDQSSISLIDLDGVRRGDWRLDVIYLREHLRLRSRQLAGAQKLNRLATTLLACFDLDPHQDFVRTMSGLVKARFAALYSLRPRWVDLSRRLAADALSILAD